MADCGGSHGNVPAEPGRDTDRRTFLMAAGLAGIVSALGGAARASSGIGPTAAVAQAQTAGAAKIEKWWPSKWGEGDEAGATNHVTPEKVLDSIRLIRDGKIYRLGRVYEQGMPLFGQRSFALRIPGGPSGGPFGDNRLVYNDEFLATEIGQVGTQFDGLGHIGIQLGADGDKNEMRFYNGFTAAEINTPYGLAKLGVEKLKPIFTRGHLFDIAGLKGGMMDAGQEITVADLRAAMQRQNMQESDIKPGDAALFNTGWGSLWMKDNQRYNSGAPGIGLEVARWIIEKDLCLAGADTWPVEVVPNPDKRLAFPVHTELICKHGILLHENLIFDEPVADRKYQFVFVFVPDPIKGATGSNGSPIAVT
jgi:kynurenine formamidase